MPEIHITRGRPSRIVQALVVVALLAAQAGVMLHRDTAPSADAASSISQIHYVPFEAQAYIDVLRSIAGDPACCSGTIESAVSVTSGADGNTVVYDHFEDGYELDPFDPQQASTITLAMDQGQVWTQSSSVPVDPRGADFYFDGQDKVVSTAPIAMTQTAYASAPGTVHAGGVQVMDVDKSGIGFEVPIGQDADYNEVFEYVGLILVGTADGTTVEVDADADGTAETTLTVDEGEVAVVDGGVNLGATVGADHPVSAYLASGDIGATYEGRFIELYPTHAWSDAYISPVGARATGDDGTRVFLYNPGTASIDVAVTDGAGGSDTVTIAPGAQGTYLMPVDAGARFASTDGSPFYALQAVTTEGTLTSAFDWGFTLIPEIASTPVVVVPYGPGSAGVTDNYSPLWVAASADTTLYVDLDGDPATGSLTDPGGNLYDFSCAVGALDSITIYDDGTANCYFPSQDAATGGDRDMTGARVYTADGTRLSSAWGQRSSYETGNPALDMGTTILPYPALLVTKSAAVSGDVDGDGQADPGDTITYTVALQNDGIVDVTDVAIGDEVPENTSYVLSSTTLDGTPQADDTDPYSPFPVDADSPTGRFEIGTVTAGTTVELAYSMVIDDPTPFGVISITNEATTASEYGDSTTIKVVRLDLEPLQISKDSVPSNTPLGSGDTIDYTIRVFNGDTAAHTNVAVTDAVPAGTTYVDGTVTADVDGIPVAAGPPPDLVGGLTLDEGEVLTIGFRVSVDAPLDPATTEFTNTASATSDQNPDPVQASATDPVGAAADLSLAKTDGAPGVLRPGDPLTYTLSVTNNGPDVAAGVTLVDTLPAGVTLDGAGTDPSCAEAPVGTVTCSLGDLAPGSTDVVIAVTVDAGVDGTLTNQATVSSPTPDPYPGDETAFVETQVDALPTLTVSKTPFPATLAEPGGTVTFSIVVTNTSPEAVDLTSLDDDVFGDLLDAGNPEVSANTCPSQPPSIDPAGTLECSFDVDFVGDVGDPVHTDVVTATVTDDEGNTASESDAATVSFTDALPSLTVAKTPSVGSLDEPGGTVTFTVGVTNTGAEPATLDVLTDDVFGDLLDAGNTAVSANTCPAAASASIPVGGLLECTFDAEVVGNASGGDHVDTVSATVSDDDGNEATATDDATVTFDDVTPAITVTKTPSPASIPEPGGPVTFTVEVVNGTGEDIVLTALDDDVFGDLLDPTNPDVAFNDCPSQPVTIPGGGTFTCVFDADVTGPPADPAHTDTVTASVADDDGNTASETATASVVITDAPPTVEVTKTASVGTVEEPGGPVTFTVEVTNTSSEEITLDALTDDVFGDLLDAANAAVSANTCPAGAGPITAGGTLACEFTAELVLSAAEGPHHDTVTATVTDGTGNEVTGSDDETVDVTDAAPSITLDKAPSVDAVTDPGGPVTFTIEVVNGSAEDLTLTGLVDDVFGDLLDPANADVTDNTCPDEPAAIAAGATLSCEFTADVAGTVDDDDHVNTVTATVVDDEDTEGTADASATVAFEAAEAEITGHVFIDLDGDGIQGPDEPDLPGIDVGILDGEGNALTVTSNPGGDWTASVAPGEATVGVIASTVPDGYVLSTDNDLQFVDVEAGATLATDDVGYAPAETGVSGAVFLDIDGDDQFDGGDVPLEDVRVVAVDEDGDVAGEATTDEDGEYLFEDLGVGTFTLRLDGDTIPDGLEASWDVDGVADRETEVEVTAGGPVTGIDFAERGTGSIGDTAWIDDDGDGVFDPDEPLLQGVVLGLVWAGFDGEFGTADDVDFGETASDADGFYEFTHLPPGDYRVTADLSTAGLGMSATTDLEFEVALGPGAEVLSADFGFEPDQDLPVTGFDVWRMLALAGALVAAGTLLLGGSVVWDRRRRTTPLREAIHRRLG